MRLRLLFLAMIAMAASAATDVRWLSIEQLAERFGFDPDTLREWRARGFGPRSVKFGTGRTAHVRYRLSEVERFEAELEAAEAQRLGVAS
jgi:hypothetical protein